MRYSYVLYDIVWLGDDDWEFFVEFQTMEQALAAQQKWEYACGIPCCVKIFEQ